MSTEAIEPPDAGAEYQPEMALTTTRDAMRALEPVKTPPPPGLAKTAQEMRVVEVSEALLPAYQKASTLELTPEEIEKIMAPFPDEYVEVRPHDGLLYIPHIHVSDRLNRIFGPGKWAMIRRREWFDADSNTMFGEYVLVIRGCYVGESVGGHPYAKNNPKINFSDVLESTAAEALRRICGKRLSLGSQVWNPEYCREWETKYRGYDARERKWFKKKPNDKSPSPAAGPARTTTPAPAAPAKTTAAAPQAAANLTSRTAFLEMFPDDNAMHYAREFFERIGAILDTEGLEDVAPAFYPASPEQRHALLLAIDAFSRGEDARLPYPKQEGSSMVGGPASAAAPAKPASKPAPAAAAEDEPWRSFPMPFGKHAGTPLGQLDKKYLYGLAMNYVVETEYNGKPKRAETIEKDRQFRKMLDDASKHYGFQETA